MAHSLDMIALVEGVETAAELEVLRELGCDVVQGYLVSRPLAEEDFAGFVESYGVGGYQL